MSPTPAFKWLSIRAHLRNQWSSFFRWTTRRFELDESDPDGSGAVGSRFQTSFALEVLRSEYLRSKILAGMAALGIVAVLVHVLLMKGRSSAVLDQGSVVAFVLATTTALLLFELGVLRILRRRLQRNAPIPRVLRYVNAALEISAVTTALVYVGYSSGSLAYALTLPVSAVYFVFIILSTLRLDALVSIFTGLAAAAQYAAIAFHATRQSFGISGESALHARSFYAEAAAVLFAGGLVAAFVARHVRHRVRRALETVEDRDRVLKVFGQYTSPDVVEEILKRPRSAVTGQRRDVCVMFLDIRGFSVFSENHEPEEVVSYLNTLFGPLIDIVHRHGGSIHQLLGDGFMAVFGAPIAHGEDVARAVEAATSIVRYVNDESDSGRIPKTRVGIGLHAGEAVVGFVGSTIHKEYKVTGDVVNLAARLEQLNKRFSSQLLVSETVWRTAEKAGFDGVDLGNVTVGGYKQALHAYRLA